MKMLGIMVLFVFVGCGCTTRHVSAVNPSPKGNSRHAACHTAVMSSTGSRSIRTVLDHCAPLITDLGCREVLTEPPDASSRAGRKADSICSEAYCDRLPAPRPAICSNSTDQHALWRLIAAIITFEAGNTSNITDQAYLNDITTRLNPPKLKLQPLDSNK